MRARIFSPTKSTMQSGQARQGRWHLVFESSSPRQIDALMGWTGSSDTTRQVRLEFADLEAAIAYAEKHGISYQVQEPHRRQRKLKAYAENFRYQTPD